MKKKIVFWIDSHLLYYCLAHSLQNKLDADYFAVIDITDKPKKFFQQQTLVAFTKLWFYHDYTHKNTPVDIEYLKQFENKYQINLWQLAINERLFYNHNNYHEFSTDEILSILEQECRLFETIIDEINPDFFITKVTALHHHHLFYEICKNRGVKSLILNQAKIGYKFMLSNELHKVDFMNHFTSSDSNRSFIDLQKYIKSFDMSKQLINYKDKHAGSKLDRIKAALQFLLMSDYNNTHTHYSYRGRTKLRVLFNESTDLLKKKYRESFINKNLSYGINSNSQFVYLPMHQEPERSLLIAAPFYTNQIETIRHIAKSLPPGYRLCVKEHYAQSIRNWRKISDYKQIMKIPNVELMHPSVSAESLLRQCSLVISVGGTSAFEAAIYEKPSITFVDLGIPISSVYKLDAIEDLPKAIRSLLKKKVNLSELNKYVDILTKNSFDFDYFRYQLDELEEFYYGGNLVDVEVPQQKMSSFLKKKQEVFDKLALEHIKKIKQFDDYSTVGKI